jgi:hypothetical protein
VKFFLDNNLPPALARALHELSTPHEVTHLREKFKADTPDVDWIQALASERDWVIVSGDIRISRNRDELRAWSESGLTAFFLEKAWAHLEFWTKATKLVQWWPTIMKQAETVQSQVGYLVPVKGAKLTIISAK